MRIAQNVETEVVRALPPATVPPEYQALKRKLMDGAEQQFAALRKLDGRLRWAEILIFLLVWVGSATLTLFSLSVPGLMGWGLRVVGIIVSGVALNVFFLLVHEGMHSILFKDSRANYWFAVLLSWPLFFSYTAFRVLHLRHHRYLGQREDPDEYTFYAKNKLSLWALHYFRFTGAAYLYLFTIPLMAFRYATSTERMRIVLEYLFLAVFCVILFRSIPFVVLLHIWLLPAAVTAYIIGVWGLTQHALTDPNDPLLASRSVQAHPLVAFCFIYENYHLEHHLFPEIPSYHLKRTHDLIWPRLPHALAVNSYLGFLVRFIFASIKLDERPIGLVELTGWEI